MEEVIKPKKKLNPTIRALLVSVIVLVGLLIVSYILTFIVQPGMFVRNPDGTIDPASYTSLTRDFPFWKFLLSPFLVFTMDDATTVALILVFLLIVAGAMGTLSASNIFKYFIDKIVHKYSKRKYFLIFAISFIFMFMGSMIGTFEETIVFIPVLVSLCIAFGWDTFTGLSISLVATACGFASGIMNPFTVGIAQKMLDLPPFSGAWLRIITFIIIYLMLSFFTYFRAKKIEKPVSEEYTSEFNIDPKMEKGKNGFLITMGVGIVITIVAALVPALQDYTLVGIALSFLVAGILAPRLSGMTRKDTAKEFFKGILFMLPAIAMILLASAIKYVLVESHTLDSILYSTMGVTQNMHPAMFILIIYLIVLFLNFFIPSGSAKAFLIVPIIGAMISINPSVSAQLCVLAFAFGDGFSNVLFPTNPVLLIGLNLNHMSYADYFKKVGLFQFAVFAVTVGLLIMGVYIGY